MDVSLIRTDASCAVARRDALESGPVVLTSSFVDPDPTADKKRFAVLARNHLSPKKNEGRR
jgi:hypothetical protein